MKTVKLFFDNCIGYPISEAIGKLLQFHTTKFEVKHINDYFVDSTPDEKWIPDISNDDWIVITADRARRYGGKKLPSICNQYNVTHILLSGKLHNAKQFEKAKAIIGQISNIIDIANEDKGGRFSLQYTSNKNFLLKAM